ncbi:MAG: CoA activase [Elusimicrobia bacterium]|nr:CoA activase [Elusimicrobiota bacterium]
MSRLSLGIDVGSVSVNAALIGEDGDVLWDLYRRHKGDPLAATADALEEALSRAGGALRLSATGSGGKLVAELCGGAFVNEIAAATRAVSRYYPQARTIIDMGGEDSKLIVLERGRGGEPRMADFSMNTVCAAGTGSFLDEQPARLGLDIETRFGELALKSSRPPAIAGRCSVFAKTDMIHLQQMATPDYDIVAGLCFALARNFRSNIGRGKAFQAPVVFMGGVAANRGMVRAFREVLGLGPGELIVPEHHGTLGAVGAALESARLAASGASAPVLRGAKALRERAGGRGDGEHHSPLPKQDYIRMIEPEPLPASEDPIDGYLGVDVGSISTNVVVIDAQGRVVARRYLMTAGRPLEAVRQGLEEVGRELGGRVAIRGACTTGSGRYLSADYIGADIAKNEITAHAAGAAFIDPEVDTIFEIGGQDSKYIRLENGAVVDFTMNKVCAAGTGSFLEEQANRLGVDVKGEFSELALSSRRPAALGERCTVFMESNLNLGQQKGVPKPDLLAGLSYSIVTNYLNRVVENRPVGRRIFFQGGTAANRAVKAAFEAVIGKPVTVPPHHDVLGAVGCALLARDRHRSTGLDSRFVGFDLSKRGYRMSSFECPGCSNNCEIHRVDIEGEERKLFYGDRCGKYDELRSARKKEGGLGSGMPDLFAERRKLLLESGAIGIRGKVRGTIGVPQTTFFHELFPFWRALFETLGYRVVLSADTNRKLIHAGLAHVAAETCLPIKVAHGHVADLLEKGPDFIFLPSVVDLPGLCSEMERSYSCPYVQSMPYIISAAMEVERKARVLRPVVHFDRGPGELAGELSGMARELGVTGMALRRAIKAGMAAQMRFVMALESRGQDVLAGLTEEDQAVVIVSRPYNGCDRGLNLEIPAKLRDLGCLAIPMDFLPLGGVSLAGDWWHMYWKYGQKILAAARIIAGDKRLNALYVTNFACGPDSFILKFFAKELGSKPHLQIEIDEHSSDVGVITRCEAFLDSLRNIREAARTAYRCYEGPIDLPRGDNRSVHIPYLDDHTYGVAAAMRAAGMDAHVLPMSDEESLRLGRKYTSGKECYPCVITTGDIIKKTLEPGFDPSRTAFFVADSSGPCRFGQYHKFYRMVLDELGCRDVKLLVFSQEQGFHFDGRKFGASFLRLGWRAMIAIDALIKFLCEVRPYERERGSTDRVYERCLRALERCVESGGECIDEVLLGCCGDFAAVPVDRSARRPRIGLIGEICVRSHAFANEHIVRRIEDLGGEAALPPFEEWLNYLSWERREEYVRRWRWGPLFKDILTGQVQNRDKKRILELFRGHLRGKLFELPTRAILDRASPYIHDSVHGEACLSIGRAVEYAEDGFDGVVNIAPFGCMPSTIVSSLTHKFRKNHRGIPWLDMYYDGTKQAGTQTRLEAFMAQAADYLWSRESSRV